MNTLSISSIASKLGLTLKYPLSSKSDLEQQFIEQTAETASSFFRQLSNHENCSSQQVGPPTQIKSAEMKVGAPTTTTPIATR